MADPGEVQIRMTRMAQKAPESNQVKMADQMAETVGQQITESIILEEKDRELQPEHGGYPRAHCTLEAEEVEQEGIMEK